MRINRYVASATGMSRRSADSAIKAGRVRLNTALALLGDTVGPNDKVSLDGLTIELKAGYTTLMLNKPVGYVCSRKGQGSKTIYDLLPDKYHRLKPVGRLDKDSSGLILLSDDGRLANELTHPRYEKEKIYRVKLNKPLDQAHQKQLLTGVALEDGLSKFIKLKDCSNDVYELVINEGRNRQIRRTFDALGYKISVLQRLQFGNYSLNPKLKTGLYQEINK